MVIFLKGFNKSAFFGEFEDLEKEYGYCSQLSPHYSQFYDQWFTLRITSHAGFFGNPSFQNEVQNSLGGDGDFWLNSSLDSRVISWTFVNIFQKGNSFTGKSANNNLFDLLYDSRITNTPIEVEVSTDETFSSEFYVGSGTDLEAGLIELVSSSENEGILWKRLSDGEYFGGIE